MKQIKSKKRSKKMDLKDLAGFPSDNPLPVLRVSENGTILYANKSSDEVLSDWNSRVEGKVPAFLQQLIKGAIIYSRRTDVEVRLKNKTYLFLISPIAGKKLANLYGVDITGRRNMEDEIKKRVEELEKFRKITIGRELRMRELKSKIKELERALEARDGE